MPFFKYLLILTSVMSSVEYVYANFTCDLVLSSSHPSIQNTATSSMLADEGVGTHHSSAASVQRAHEEIKVFEIAENHKVAYRYTPPQDGKETIVLTNGLIYSLDYWSEYYDGLVEQGYGVLLIAFSTQPESLSFLDSGVVPHFGSIGINLADPAASTYDYKLDHLESQTLVDEVVSLINHLEIDDFHLVSLSYSSFISINIAIQQKNRIKTFIPMAPAVMPSNRYDPIGSAKHNFYEMLRMNPFVNADYLSDFELYSIMYWALFQQFVNLPNKLTDFDKFFNGVYQMVRSVKWKDLKDYRNADLPITHLFLAAKEEAALYDDQLKFWELMEPNQAKGSLVVFLEALHALPSSATNGAIEQTIKAVEGELNENYIEVDSE